MADNTELNSGSGGDTFRTLEDASNIKWPVSIIAYATTVGTPDVLTIPTAAALADDTANPTLPLGASCLLNYDGATWDRVRGTSTDGLLVNLGSNNDVTLATLPDTAAGDLAAMVVDLAAIEVLITAGNVDLAAMEVLLTGIDSDTNAIKTATELIDDAVYADDAAFTLTTSKVIAGGAVRDDSLSTLTAVEGDVVPLRVGSTGALHVTGAGGGTEYNEDAATPATITGTASVMERDDALTTLTPIEGDWAAFRCTAEGALWTQDFNSDAILTDTNAMVVDLAAIEVLQTSIDGKITACDTGAVVLNGVPAAAALSDAASNPTTLSFGSCMLYFDGANWKRLRGDASNGIVTNIGYTNNAIYTDDADWADGTSKHMLTGGLYQSAPQTITDGDVGPFQVTANGYLITSINGTVTVGSHAVTNAGTFAVQESGAALTALQIIDDWDDGADHCEVVGAAAEDAAVAGAPVLTGGRYDTTSRTLDNGDAGAVAVSAEGWMMVGNQSKFLFDGATKCEIQHFHAVTSTSDTSLITAQAGKRFRILSLTIMGLGATVTNVHLETKTTNTDCFGDSTNPIPIAVDADGDNVAGIVLAWNPGGWFETADANEDMAVILSAAQPVLICGNYIEVT